MTEDDVDPDFDPDYYLNDWDDVDISLVLKEIDLEAD